MTHYKSIVLAARDIFRRFFGGGPSCVLGPLAIAVIGAFWLTKQLGTTMLSKWSVTRNKSWRPNELRTVRPPCQTPLSGRTTPQFPGRRRIVLKPISPVLYRRLVLACATQISCTAIDRTGYFTNPSIPWREAGSGDLWNTGDNDHTGTSSVEPNRESRPALPRLLLAWTHRIPRSLRMLPWRLESALGFTLRGLAPGTAGRTRVAESLAWGAGLAWVESGFRRLVRVGRRREHLTRSLQPGCQLLQTSLTVQTLFRRFIFEFPKLHLVECDGLFDFHGGDPTS
jgi:hypothetical protein